MKVIFNEPMSKHTSFKAGGPSACYCKPDDVAELINLIKFLNNNKINFRVIGNGTNILVSDLGVREVVIEISDNISEVLIDNTKIEAFAGARLNEVARIALLNSLTGFEELSGIPGLVGGACMMNAGAYGREIKDVLVGVDIIDEFGSIKYLDAEELELSYRSSNLEERGAIVIKAYFNLEIGEKNFIEEKMREYNLKRKEKQPLDYPSAGSTFKRPESGYASKLIDDAGLKGFSIGDAKVSERHAGFIINTGNAKARDIYSLIELIRKQVSDKFDVELKTEVKLWGDF